MMRLAGILGGEKRASASNQPFPTQQLFILGMFLASRWAWHVTFVHGPRIHSNLKTDLNLY